MTSVDKTDAYDYEHKKHVERDEEKPVDICGFKT